MKAAVVVVLAIFISNFKLAADNLPQHRNFLNRPKTENLPLIFEPNRGQVSPSVCFVSRTPAATFFFTKNGITIGLAKGPHSQVSFGVGFAGAAALPVMNGLKPVPSKSNYLNVDQPERSISGIENYAAVEYQNLYPGITVRYYGTQQKMEHDLRIAPGAGLNQIKLKFDGISHLRRVRNGDLHFDVDGIPMTQTVPVTYQLVSGVREPLRAAYVLLGKDLVGYSVQGWNGKHPLIIDPILANSTYLGGDTEANFSQGTTSLTALTSVSSISSDQQQNVYITGTTTAIDFPVTSGAFQTTSTHLSEFHADTVSQSGFVTKLGKFGQLIYSTYLMDSIAAGSASPEGYVYVAKNGFNNFNGPGDGIDPGIRIVKLDLSGSKILYDYTYAGSPSVECSGICTQATSVAATFGGRVWVAGTNTEVPLKTTPGAYQATSPSNGANIDGFVLRLDTKKTGDASILAATYIGGSNGDDKIAAVGVDPDTAARNEANLYDAADIVGQTTSSDFPKNAEFNSGGTETGFVAQISSDGKHLVYSALLHNATATSVSVLYLGHFYVGGSTTSSTFPVSVNALQKHNAGKRDGLFLAFSIAPNTGEGTLFYSTYIGGSENDEITGVGSVFAQDIAVFGEGAVGWTESSDFPITSTAFRKTNPAPHGRAAFAASITNIDPGLDSRFRYSTYVGPVTSDTPFLHQSPAGMVMPSPYDIWIAGTTDSPDYPTKYSPVQASMHGLQSGFVSKIVSKVDLAVTAHPSSTEVNRGDLIVYHVRVVNHGPDPAEFATLILSLEGSQSADRTLLGVKTSSSQASCPSPDASVVFCDLGDKGLMPAHAVYYIDLYMRAMSKTPVTYPFHASLSSESQELPPDQKDNQVSISIIQP